MTRRASSASMVVGLAVCGLLWIPPPLGGDPGPVSQLNWIFDGAVQGAARLGDTLYVGGTFQAVAPSANALPAVFALSETTGGVVGPAFPQTDGDVYAIEADGSGGYFLGGDFATIGGTAQAYLAHVTSAGQFDPAFRPALDGVVRRMGRIGTSLYVLGEFGTIGGTTAFGIGAVSTSDGSRLAWTPEPAGRFPIDLLVADDRVVLASVRRISLQLSAGDALALDALTGAVLWTTPLVGQGPTGGVQVGPLIRLGSRVIVAHGTGAQLGSRGLSSLSLSAGAVDPAWSLDVTPTAMALAGTTLYVGGSFTNVAGQSRQNLAAIDINTAALLPWNPGSLTPIIRMAATGGGMVYVSGLFSTIAGQPRHRLAQIDAAGNVTPWIANTRPDSYYALREGAAGTVLAASSLTATGSVARPGAAAFDLTTGDLLPWSPTPAPAGGIRRVAAAAGRVFLTDGVFTSTFNAASGASIGGIAGEVFFAEDPWIYVIAPGVRAAPRAVFRIRIDDELVDESWRWSAFAAPSVAADAGTLYLAAGGLTAVDKVTGRVRWQRPTADVRHVAISGNTLYADSGVFGLATFDARTGTPIASRTTNVISAIGVVDGRLVVAGSDGLIPPRDGFTGLTLDGSRRVWTPALRRTLIGGPATFLGRLATPGSLVGPVLVTGGVHGTRATPASQGLAVFPLDGPRGPAELRARHKGPVLEFSWDTPTTPPAGGYVLEAGTTPGLPFVALPVGTASTFSAIVPPGTLFVRVRTSGAAGGVEEVSNEIIVNGGCATAPPPPTGLQVSVNADVVTLSWVAPDALVSAYLVSAAAVSGGPNVASVAVAGDRLTFSALAPPSTYFVRVRAANSCGTSAASAEVFFTVDSATALPTAPTGLGASVAANTVTLQWTAPAGPVSGYVLEAGSDVGLTDITTAALGSATSLTVPGVPPGVYLVRVRAVNAAGSGPTSTDVVVRVP